MEVREDMKVDLVVAGVVASVVLAVVLVGAVASDVQGSKKKRKALHEVPFFDYSSFRSSTLSPSVGAISSSKSVMPALMRMSYHCRSFLISLL